MTVHHPPTDEQGPGVLDIPFPGSFHLDPAPTWTRLREDCPVTQVRTLSGDVVWLVTRYQDVRTVLADARFSRAGTVAAGAPQVAVARPLPGTLPTTDPPEHTRLRRLVSGAFSHRRVETMRPWIRELAGNLADDIAAAGTHELPVDLRVTFALPLPIRVICHLLGVPYGDRDRFRVWTELAYSMQSDEADRVRDAMAQLTAYLRELVEAKRAELAGRAALDILDELILADVDGDRLDTDELAAFGMNLLVAGHETSANQITSFVATLLREPALWDRLAAEPALLPGAVEELLRHTRLSEMGQLRVAAEDVVLGGQLIRAGEGVMAALSSANRDPSVFDRPEQVLLDREPGRHLAFGTGPHFCLGAHLARVELQEALAALLARFPGLRLAVPAEQLRWRRVLVSGVAELPVRW
ncbi:MAG: cytochrome P450 [Actinocatenispora sp.]